MVNQEQLARETRFEIDLWWGVFAGPISWAVGQGSSYAMVQHACSTGHIYVLYLIDVAAILIALSGFYMALKNFRRFPEGQPSGGKPHDRAHFQCILGMIFSLGFVVVNLAIALPRWIMSPCS